MSICRHRLGASSMLTSCLQAIGGCRCAREIHAELLDQQAAAGALAAAATVDPQDDQP